MDKVERFILKPDFNNLTEQGLKIIDNYIYPIIRSFCEDASISCTPTYSQISKLSGCSVQIIKRSIERLKLAGYVEHKRDSRFNKNIFTFIDKGFCSKVPMSILKDSDLSVKEKSTWIVMNEYVIDDFIFSTSREMANDSGLNSRSFRKVVNGLKAKTYLHEDLLELDYPYGLIPVLILLDAYWDDK